ncbi:MAG TPA: hypothetical protein VKB84_26795, partial [Candidatus Binataceae bacterium]|nr:hypothetical protein [Candidatus Binataceae bacterium]
MASVAELVISLRSDIAQFRSKMSTASQSVVQFGEAADGLKNKINELVTGIAEFLAIREVVNFMREAVAQTNEWALSPSTSLRASRPSRRLP